MKNLIWRESESHYSPVYETFIGKLRRANADWFEDRGYKVNDRLPYLLESRSDWPNNIILPEVSEYVQAEQKHRNALGNHFPLHKYIHHGLSSQAMLFNLIGPLMATSNLSPFLKALEGVGLISPSGNITAEFEVEDSKLFNENRGHPTSIDLVITGEGDARPLYIEAKLSERGFGGCSKITDKTCDGNNPSVRLDQCYLHYIGRLYWVWLERYKFSRGPMASSPICPLAFYYQFFRELVFALVLGGDFVLLYDERNPMFYNDLNKIGGIMPLLMKFVPVDLQERVHSITIQEVVRTYKNSGELPWLPEFEKKYALQDVDR